MAKFDAKSFNEKAFGKYMTAVPNVKLNKGIPRGYHGSAFA